MTNKKTPPSMITRYAYAKKHGVSNQLIYARVAAGTIPTDADGLIDENFPFVRHLKSGRKAFKKG